MISTSKSSAESCTRRAGCKLIRFSRSKTKALQYQIHHLLGILLIFEILQLVRWELSTAQLLNQLRSKQCCQRDHLANVDVLSFDIAIDIPGGVKASEEVKKLQCNLLHAVFSSKLERQM